MRGRITKLSPEDEAKRFERLPQWAQNRITLLEHEVEVQKDKVQELSNQHPNTNVHVNGFINNPDYDLPADSQIDFIMGDSSSERWHDKISVSHIRSEKDRESLRIQGYQSLVIRMSASNSFEVSFDKR